VGVRLQLVRDAARGGRPARAGPHLRGPHPRLPIQAQAGDRRQGDDARDRDPAHLRPHRRRAALGSGHRHPRVPHRRRRPPLPPLPGHGLRQPRRPPVAHRARAGGGRLRAGRLRLPARHTAARRPGRHNHGPPLHGREEPGGARDLRRRPPLRPAPHPPLTPARPPRHGPLRRDRRERALPRARRAPRRPRRPVRPRRRQLEPRV
ncbi:MAG: MarC family integral membrane protein, partial [uncultured Rubrobacteraceae bacterium]